MARASKKLKGAKDAAVDPQTPPPGHGESSQSTPAAPADKVEKPKAGGSYETTDGNEALKLQQAGGHVVSVTKLHPNNPFKAGKLIRFAETKAQLDKLVARAEEGE